MYLPDEPKVVYKPMHPNAAPTPALFIIAICLMLLFVTCGCDSMEPDYTLEEYCATFGRVDEVTERFTFIPSECVVLPDGTRVAQ